MTALVTGGGGFLGGVLVRQLLARGDSVRSFSRSAHAWLEPLGVPQFQGDLTDAEALRRAADGCGVVFHVAAKAGVWGDAAAFRRTNVSGTVAVLDACRAAGVPKLVFTSTPSVVHSGGDLCGADESLPYPKHFAAAYPATKAEAEQAVLAANGSTLSTVALRPHLIWGPGDPHLIPRVLARARAGKLRRVGTRPVVVDVTYVDNAAEAHLNAADRLTPGSACAGKAYFVSNGEPVELWEFLGRVLALNGLDPAVKAVSPWKARLAAGVFERVYRTLGLTHEPPLTRFVVEQLSTSHWYDIAAARRDLGYAPRVSVAEGLARMAGGANARERAT